MEDDRELSIDELEWELHMAGLDAHQPYRQMGKGGGEWRHFRLRIAQKLLDRNKIYRAKKEA